MAIKSADQITIVDVTDAYLKFPINLQRISTAGNLRGFIFATSWTELIRVDDRLQELTFF